MRIRSKLMAAAVMLIISAIMMTSASFAWFTISTAPEVANINTSVTSNGNLEIALDSTGSAPAAFTGTAATFPAGSNTEWGNLIDLNGQLSDVVLKPVLFADNSFKTPTYGLDGRVSGLSEALTGTGTGVIKYNNLAFQIDLWMNSNVVGDVTLSEAAARGAGEAGLGSTLDNAAVTVVFVNGNNTVTAKKAADSNVLTPVEGSGTTIANFAAATDAKSAGEINVPQKVSVYVFMDGTGVTNASVGNIDAAANLNIQFKHSVTLDPMEVTGSGSGRTTPSAGN